MLKSRQATQSRDSFTSIRAKEPVVFGIDDVVIAMLVKEVYSKRLPSVLIRSKTCPPST